MRRNPKQVDTNLFDCIPQKGPCPNNCSQCYYNHNFDLPIMQSHFPSVEEVGDGIVRVNSGHDSNFNRDYVIRSTKQYPKRFFNTSKPLFYFPDPVVFTANAKEEELPFFPGHFTLNLPGYLTVNKKFQNLMFIRLRVSSTNLFHIIQAAKAWYSENIPVVLTFMRYFNRDVFSKQNPDFYIKRTNINNTYWCPTEEFQKFILEVVKKFNPNIEVCGHYCKDCLNCEKYYYLTKGRMNANSTSQ